jgi:CRP-like cAMP-binding protein
MAGMNRMAEIDWKTFIKSSELLGSLNRSEIDRLLKPDASEEKKYVAGEAIVKQDERGRSFYLIGSGSVAITRPAPEGGEINLAVLESGEFFGEMALLSQQPRSATVKAREACTVLRINADILKTLLHRHPEILTEIFMMLSERLRDLAERVVNVSYNEVSNKLELFSTKLDAELKAVNSTLAATQVVFDQTTQRANEVIAGTERHWKRLTMIASVATTLVVSGLGWFGFSSYQDFVASTERATKRISEKMQDVETKTGLIDQTAHRAESIKQKLEEQYSALQSGATYSVVPILQNLAGRNDKGAQYYIPILQNNLKLLLSSNEEHSVTIVFKEIYTWMTTTLIRSGDVSDVRNFQRQVDLIFNDIVDSKQDMPLRNRALSYYFLLANLAIEQSESEFDIRLNELNKLLRNESSWIILETDRENFEPAGFELALEVLNIPPAQLDAIKQRITTVWNKISRS